MLILGRAATLNGVDDHPLRRLGGGRIFSERDLARTTSMDCGTRELERLRGTDSHLVDFCTRVARGLARKVGAAGIEGRIIWAAVRNWRVHDHMSAGRSEGHGRAHKDRLH